MRRWIAFIVNGHLASIHSRAIRNNHLVTIRLASHNGKSVLHLRLNIRRERELLLVGEINEVAILIINLEANSACAANVISSHTSAGGCSIVIAVDLIVVHEVAPLAHICITDRYFAIIVNAVCSLRLAFKRAIGNSGRGLDAVIDEADARSLRILMHISLRSINICLSCRYPIIAVVAYKLLIVRNEHTIHFEEFAQVELSGIAHLLGHLQIVVLSVSNVGCCSVAIAIYNRCGWTSSLLHWVLTKHLEERGIEVGLVSLSMEIEVELIVHSRLLPDAHSEPSCSFCKVLERFGYR